MLTVDLDRARVDAQTRVLDLGCGGGRHAYACLKSGAHVVALDLDHHEVKAVSEMVEALRAGGEVCSQTHDGAAVADALKLPFLTASFDVVIASEVLEHVVADQLAMNELSRVLRPGGMLALSVPRAWPEALNWALSRDYHSKPGGHCRIYRKAQLRERLAMAELDLVSSHHRHALHSPYWWLRCLVGVTRDEHLLVKTYHRFLVYDIVKHPRWTRLLERALDPLLGKSLVLYLERA